MTPEQKAAFVNAQVAVFNARVAGMIAENAQRVHIGQSLAYGEGDFTAIEREYDALLSNNLLDFFRD